MMSEDDKKTPEDEAVKNQVIETVDAIEEIEEDVEAAVEENIVELDEKLEDVNPIVAKSGAGFGSLLVAALLGGVATVALIGGLGYYAVSSNNLGGLGNLLNGGDAAAANEERYTDVSTRILSLEGELAELQNVAPATIDFAPISDEITALADKLATESDQVTAIGERIGSVEQSIAFVAQKDDGGFDNTIIIALQTELNDLKKDMLANSGNVVEGNNEELNAAVEAVQSKMAELETEIAAVKSIAEAASAAGTQISNGDASNMASALAVAALERALQDEQPFEVELNAIKGVAGDNAAFDNAALTKLAEYAVTGLASETSLMGQFDGLLEAALVADLKGEGTSVLDKFIGNAKSIISIRKTGNVDGNSAEAVLARMEVAVQAKDLSAAVETGNALEGPAKKVFENWLTSATSRLAAKDLMRQVSADILTSLQ